MKSPVYTMAIHTFVPMLRSLSDLLDKGAQHASEKKFEPAVLVNGRLAPDMYPLVRQVQFACDLAKGLTARLMGQEPPNFADNEATINDLKARIARTIDYLEDAPAAAFEGAEDRDIKLPLGTELVLEMKGLQFLRDWALPNFYFHVVTAYGILRHHGVDIGKHDYPSHAASAIRPRDERDS